MTAGQADPAAVPGPASLDRVRLARVALGWFADSGNYALWSRVAAHGPVRVLDSLLAQGVEIRGDHPGQASAGPADPRELAAAAIAQGRRLGARLVVPEDDEWLPQLDQLVDVCRQGREPIDRDAAPPLCLWVRGQGTLTDVFDRSVAVVGARAASHYGAHVARQIGYGLATEGWTVVSGGAYGIDAEAHRGALAAGGRTVVVLATGIDRVYPAGNANLFDRIVDSGLLVSEWPPAADPFRHRFLIRNRLIAAGTRGTVLVEAAARSGARQTLRRAGQLNRVRMVVPGPVTSAMSVGCHLELRDDPRVRLVTAASEILEEVGRVGADLAPVPRGPERARDHLAPLERRLVEALLKRKPLPTEAVAARARVPFADATRLLPSLVLRGYAQRRGHGFVLAAGEVA